MRCPPIYRTVLFVAALCLAAVVCVNSEEARFDPAAGADQSEVVLLRKGADQGNVEAQVRLGFSHLSGEGVPQRLTAEVEWYRAAADQGDAEAQNNLGTMYERGNGVAQSLTTAVEWYRKAADQGHAEALNSLGLMYGHGKGVAQSHTLALEVFRKAANQGHAEALNNLGLRGCAGGGRVRGDGGAAEHRKAHLKANTRWAGSHPAARAAATGLLTGLR